MASRRDQVDYLATIAEEGQFATAAKRLNIGQAALSRAITQLEAEVGVELLERGRSELSLTNAGETFLGKARVALAAEHDAVETARAVGRSGHRSLVVGFIGPPPAATSPELFAAFADAQPWAEVSVVDLAFPSGATSSWLAGVDVAFCHRPRIEAGVSSHAVRIERRAVVVGRAHRLARRTEVGVSELLEETFVGYHADVQAEWAGFHSLDDHRGGPPTQSTADQARTSLQMLGIMASGAAVTTVPKRDAELAQLAVGSIAAITVTDAHPAVVSLVWRSENANPLIGALLAAAGEIDEDDGA